MHRGWGRALSNLVLPFFSIRISTLGHRLRPVPVPWDGISIRRLPFHPDMGMTTFSEILMWPSKIHGEHEDKDTDAGKDGMAPSSRSERKKRYFTLVIQEISVVLMSTMFWAGMVHAGMTPRAGLNAHMHGLAFIATRLISSLEGIRPWANAHVEDRRDDSASAGSSHWQHLEHIRSQSRGDPGCPPPRRHPKRLPPFPFVDYQCTTLSPSHRLLFNPNVCPS
jgi:hypothetical protein